jgi:class 3 adenylate cyclase
VAKGRAVKVLASGETVRRASAGESERWRDVGTVALRGRVAPSAIFEPVAEVPTPRR